MRLQARVFPLDPPARARVVEVLGPGADAQSSRFAVPLDDALPRMLDVAHASFWVSGEAVFTRSELDSFTHFEAACRSVVPETEQDHEANFAHVKATPLLDAGGFAPIRLVRGFRLSSLRMKPNAIGAIGDWTGEYVLGPAAAQVMREANATGYALAPLADAAGGAHPDHHQLASDAILPPARVDASVERVESAFPEEDGRLRHLGCLAYLPGDLAKRTDFNRTAEPWAGAWGWPSWVVNARVAALLRGAGVRGWAFRPVLVDGSPLYDTYLREWERLRAIVAAAPAGQLDGGRW